VSTIGYPNSLTRHCDRDQQELNKEPAMITIEPQILHGVAAILMSLAAFVWACRRRP